MNRRQRRDVYKNAKKGYSQMPNKQRRESLQKATDSSLIYQINSCLVELEARGIQISDWDDSAKILRRIQIRHGGYRYLTEDSNDKEG